MTEKQLDFFCKTFNYLLKESHLEEREAYFLTGQLTDILVWHFIAIINENFGDNLPINALPGVRQDIRKFIQDFMLNYKKNPLKPTDFDNNNC